MLERDPVSFVVITVTMGLGIAVGIVELIVRKIRNLGGWGRGAVIAGVAVILISLFGWLLGLATIGVDGVLIVLSGVPTRSRNPEVKEEPRSRIPTAIIPHGDSRRTFRVTTLHKWLHRLGVNE
jgi:hypothetical protein